MRVFGMIPTTVSVLGTDKFMPCLKTEAMSYVHTYACYTDEDQATEEAKRMLALVSDKILAFLAEKNYIQE